MLGNEVMNGFECQRAFESQLLQKRGREVHPQTPGAFEFDIHSYVNPCSEEMGVHERYFHTRPTSFSPSSKRGSEKWCTQCENDKMC